jgi:hypothetical protein
MYRTSTSPATRALTERAHYSDIDMKIERDDKGMRYTKKNGEPY